MNTHAILLLSLSMILVAGLVVVFMKIMQLRAFTRYLKRQAYSRYQQRIALLAQGQDPSVIPYYDVPATFKKFDRLMPWQRDFKCCEVFEIWPCDH